MIRSFAVSAVAVVVFDVFELLFVPVIPSWTPIVPLKLAVYGVIGFFLVRGSGGAAKAMMAVGLTVAVDIGIGRSVAPIVVLGPSVVFATPVPMPADPRGSGFGTPLPVVVVYQRAESPVVSIAHSIPGYASAGAIGIVAGSVTRSVREG